MKGFSDSITGGTDEITGFSSYLFAIDEITGFSSYLLVASQTICSKGWKAMGGDAVALICVVIWFAEMGNEKPSDANLGALSTLMD